MPITNTILLCNAILIIIVFISLLRYLIAREFFNFLACSPFKYSGNNETQIILKIKIKIETEISESLPVIYTVKYTNQNEAEIKLKRKMKNKD